MINELTPIEKSRSKTGYRFFRVDPNTYIQLSTAVDNNRGYPFGEGTDAVTLRGLPPIEDLQTEVGGSYKLIQIDCWRFTSEDDLMLSSAIDDGLVEELEEDRYKILVPINQNM